MSHHASVSTSDGDPLSPHDDDPSDPQDITTHYRLVQTRAPLSFGGQVPRHFVGLCIALFCCLVVCVIIPLAVALIIFIAAYVTLSNDCNNTVVPSFT